MRHHVQAVVEILAEFAFLDPPRQIAIGGRHHPYVHLDGFRTAQPLHLAFLQHAQQFGLQIHGQFADFVQEQGAALRLLEAARCGSGTRR